MQKVTTLDKNKIPHEFYLVTAWAFGSQRPIELLTSKPIACQEDALEIILGYLSRWSVEETYRFLKAGNGLEAMRCFSFHKLKNLVRGVFLAASLVARMSAFTSWRTLFSRTALRDAATLAAGYSSVLGFNMRQLIRHSQGKMRFAA